MSLLKKIIPFIIILSFYIFIAPVYIQGGDTAELVAASYHKLIAHPPGYPLFLWLQYIWTHLFQVSTVFWRASILSSFFGLMVLFIFSKSYFRFYWLWLLPIFVLGTKKEFIDVSVLPDVFSLHALFISLICYFFLFSKNEKKYLWLAALFCFSFTNHHTTLFVFPIFCYAFWESFKKGQQRSFVYVTAISSFLVLLIYLSLLFFQIEHPLSWGNISNIRELIKHFLRSDYGTFRLTTMDQENDSSVFGFMLKSLWPEFLIALSSFVLALMEKKNKVRQDKNFWIWSCCLLFSLSFFFMMNIVPLWAGEEILSRFMVMPLIVLVGWTLYLLLNVQFNKTKTAFLLFSSLPALVLNAIHIPHYLTLRNDSTIEDYARNVYKISSKRVPALVFMDGDSTYFAARYIQAFDKSKKEVSFVSTTLFFHPWYMDKVQSKLPTFIFPERMRVLNEKKMSRVKDLILPNLSHLNIIAMSGVDENEAYKLTYLSLGRMIQEGQGIYFEEEPMDIHFVPDIFNNGPQHFSKTKIFYDYSKIYLARAFFNIQKGTLKAIQDDWEKAVSTVPYAYPAMENLCNLSPEKYDFCIRLPEFKKLTEGMF